MATTLVSVDEYLHTSCEEVFVHTAEGARRVTEGLLRTHDGSVEIPLSEIFPA